MDEAGLKAMLKDTGWLMVINPLESPIHLAGYLMAGQITKLKQFRIVIGFDATRAPRTGLLFQNVSASQARKYLTLTTPTHWLTPGLGQWGDKRFTPDLEHLQVGDANDAWFGTSGFLIGRDLNDIDDENPPGSVFTNENVQGILTSNDNNTFAIGLKIAKLNEHEFSS